MSIEGGRRGQPRQQIEVTQADALQLRRDLRRYRKEAGYRDAAGGWQSAPVSQEGIARIIHHDPTHVQHFETGRMRKSGTLVAFAEKIIGMAEPINGPEPLTPEEERKERRRQQHAQQSRQVRRMILATPEGRERHNADKREYRARKQQPSPEETDP